MLATLQSRAALGIDAPPITIEVDLARGLPAFSIVGLPEASVREARDRVRSALANSRFEFPQCRITVNLAPADLPKQGSHFDLAIALGILVASAQLPAEAVKAYEFCAELALSGALRPLTGAVPMALACRTSGRTLVLPQASAGEVAVLPQIRVLGAVHLLAVVSHLLGQQPLPLVDAAPVTQNQAMTPDIAEVVGQPLAKRALLLAACGGHHLLMFGPPGSGKSMLASRLPGLLPPLAIDDALQVAAIRSAAGQALDGQTWRQRPFRAPHHTCSTSALIGGGSMPRPGEITLSHHGVLFLDELPEYNRHALESLREPLESGEITVSRSQFKRTFPARFQLVAALNPCPCGQLGNPKSHCRCSSGQIQRYLGKLSGPLLDRFDIQIEVPAIDNRCLVAPTESSPGSAALRARVAGWQEQQLSRQGRLNVQLDSRALEQHARLDGASRDFLLTTSEKLGLSARAFHKLLRLARTIADVEGADAVRREHLAEAIGYRALHRRLIQQA